MESLSPEVNWETKACNTVCYQSMGIDSFPYWHYLGENAILKNSEKLKRECRSLRLSGWVKITINFIVVGYWSFEPKSSTILFLCSQFETVHRKVYQNTLKFCKLLTWFFRLDRCCMKVTYHLWSCLCTAQKPVINSCVLKLHLQRIILISATHRMLLC